MEQTNITQLNEHICYYPIALAYDFTSSKDFLNHTCKIIVPGHDLRHSTPGSTPVDPIHDYIGHIVYASKFGESDGPFWQDVIHPTRSVLNPDLTKEEGLQIYNKHIEDAAALMGETPDLENGSLANFRDYFLDVPMVATLVHGIRVKKKFHVLGPAHTSWSDLTSYKQSEGSRRGAFPSGIQGNAPTTSLKPTGGLRELWDDYVLGTTDHYRTLHSDQRGWGRKFDNTEITIKDGEFIVSVDNGITFYMDRESGHMVLRAKTIDLMADTVRWNGAPLNDNLVSSSRVEDKDGQHVPSNFNDKYIMSRHEFMARQEPIEGSRIAFELIKDRLGKDGLDIENRHKLFEKLLGASSYTNKLNSIIQGVGRLAAGTYDDITEHLGSEEDQQLRDGQFVKDERWEGERVSSKAILYDPGTLGEKPSYFRMGFPNRVLGNKGVNITDAVRAFMNQATTFDDHMHLVHEQGEHHIRPGEMKSYPFQEVFKSRSIEIMRLLLEAETMKYKEISNPLE